MAGTGGSPDSRDGRHAGADGGDQGVEVGGRGDAVAGADHVHVALAPVALGAADEQPAGAGGQTQLQQGDGRLGVGGEVHGDQVGNLHAGQLPLDLLAEAVVADGLLPGGVPVVAAGVEDGDV